MGEAYGSHGQKAVRAHDWVLRTGSQGTEHDLRIHWT